MVDDAASVIYPALTIHKVHDRRQHGVRAALAADALTSAAARRAPRARGLHSSTVQLNRSRFGQ